MYPDRATFTDLNFRDLRHVGPEDILQCDATAGSLRQRLSPAGLFRGEIENRFRAWRFAKKRAPIFDRVPLGCGR